jgi:hypothetical protein
VLPTLHVGVATSHRYLGTLWQQLQEHSDVRLRFSFLFNSTERGTTSKSTAKRSRPDTLVVAKSCTLLVGEDKQVQHLHDAMVDLKRKMSGGFSAHHYGPVQFLLAYTAAVPEIQFWAISCTGQVCGWDFKVPCSFTAGLGFWWMFPTQEH